MATTYNPFQLYPNQLNPNQLNHNQLNPSQLDPSQLNHNPSQNLQSNIINTLITANNTNTAGETNTNSNKTTIE